MQRGLTALGLLGSLGLLVFFIVGLTEIATGNGNDPVPTLWIVEPIVSLGVMVIGLAGWLVAELLGSNY